MNNRLTQLEYQQKKAISTYLSKWSSIILSPTKDCEKIEGSIYELVREIYSLAGFSAPEVLYLSSKDALTFMLEANSKILGKGIEYAIEDKIVQFISEKLKKNIEHSIWRELWLELTCEFQNSKADPLDQQIELIQEMMFSIDEWDKIQSILWIEVDPTQEKTDDGQDIAQSFRYNSFSKWYWASYCCLFDFCISELGCHYPEKHWSILERFVTTGCHYIFPYEKLCIAMHSTQEANSALKRLETSKLQP